MKSKISLLLMCATFAGLSNAYTTQGVTDDKLGVSAPVGEYQVGANKLEIEYSYLLLGDRTLKINYNVEGTSCQGTQELKGQKGIAVKDKVTVDCDLAQTGVFNSHAEMCSFDGDIQKTCVTDDGQITVK